MTAVIQRIPTFSLSPRIRKKGDRAFTMGMIQPMLLAISRSVRIVMMMKKIFTVRFSIEIPQSATIS